MIRNSYFERITTKIISWELWFEFIVILVPTVTITCKDELTTCDEYQADLCSNHLFRLFREKNCRKFCGICKGTYSALYVAIFSSDDTDQLNVYFLYFCLTYIKRNITRIKSYTLNFVSCITKCNCWYNERSDYLKYENHFSFTALVSRFLRYISR